MANKLWITVTSLVGLLPALAGADAPLPMLQQLDSSPHMQQVSQSNTEVVDHEVGLGAMKKVRGSWQFKDSERLSGELTRYTWQVLDGFTSNEVLAEIEAQLDSDNILFTCDGRSCGQGVQWANRVFRERVLYGRDDLQRYRVYAITEAEQAYRLVLFSSSRTADRQYLHAQVLAITP